MTKQLILADKERENAAAAEDDTGVASHTKQLLREESKSHDELTATAGINPESAAAANENALDASESALKDQELDEDLRE